MYFPVEEVVKAYKTLKNSVTYNNLLFLEEFFSYLKKCLLVYIMEKTF
jgi:hypothetical protein